MALAPDLTDTIRQLLDVFTTKSIHDWSRYVKASGLSMPLFAILMHLYYRDSCSVSQLGDYLNISAAASSQLVERLVQNGLLERAEEPNNRRTKRLTLTREGRTLIETGLATRHTWVDAVIARLSPEERRRLERGMDVLARNLQQIQEDEQPQAKQKTKNSEGMADE